MSNLHGVIYAGVFPTGRCPHGDKPPCYSYEGGLSRLARFSGLCTNSMDVYVRAVQAR